MSLFWFFGAYFVDICGKLGMRIKFVSRHVGFRTFFYCFGYLEKIMNCFQIHHNFQLAYILIFQKRYICSKKIFDIKKLFKKMWPKFPLFSPNFDFKAKLYNEIFKISNSYLGRNILNLPQVGIILDRDENFASDCLDLLL
jgi:hypothetical protein